MQDPSRFDAPATPAPVVNPPLPNAVPNPEPTPAPPYAGPPFTPPGAGQPAPIYAQQVPVAPLPPQPVVSTAPMEEPLSKDAPRGNAMNPILALLLGGALSCGLVALGMGLQRRADTSGSEIQSMGGVLPVVNEKSGNAIVNAVKLVGPAVMNVDTTFGKGGNAEFLPDPGEMGPRRGKGTGVVFDSKRRLMLTNAHVVAGAQNLQVTTRDGKRIDGKVLGFDRLNDIAVVRLNSANLPAAKLASYKSARELAIGQWTIAIGNPYAQANTVTVGVLSAVGRTIPVPGEGDQERFELKDMMQTDTAINPGNSGGPLCNIKGEVIGINTAIIPFATGLGFTIPINKAKAVADRIIANNGQNAYLGIIMKDISPALQQEFGLSDRRGTLVTNVVAGSPAAKAGIQPGDVIRSSDGKPLPAGNDARRELLARVRSKKIGSSMKLEIVRNNSQKKTVSVKIGAQAPQ